ncbi:hypothetical protein HYV49_00250 [Candidatus Pacearchaeota archaeon]|nr:hypothetical protein [Candidatus Pacearchaeota archaeon]
MIESEENKKKGIEAESKFREWLDKHNIPYIYLQQDTQTISPAFKRYFSGKRPDFLILIPHFGFIFVDIKYKNLNQTYKTYPMDGEETKRYSSIQRRFNLNIWYAISNEELDYKTWFWIPISKIFESGLKKYTSSVSREEFYAVPIQEFVQIAMDDSLDRLLSKIFLEGTKTIS